MVDKLKTENLGCFDMSDKTFIDLYMKKGSVPISAGIEKTTFECLQKFCENSGLGKTVTLERVLNMYMDEY